MRRAFCLLFIAALSTLPLRVAWAGGPFGIDHRVAYDNSGIWSRRDQKVLVGATVLGVVGGAFVLGDQDKLGDTFWRSLDSMVVSSAISQAAKWTFRRERPSETGDPDEWFKSFHDQSFPSGEVTAIAGAITPFVASYGHEHPAVYALELLPLYDAIARVKTHGHWQSDVLAGWALGTAVGIWATRRQSPLILGWLPHGFEIGFIHRF